MPAEALGELSQRLAGLAVDSPEYQAAYDAWLQAAQDLNDAVRDVARVGDAIVDNEADQVAAVAESARLSGRITVTEARTVELRGTVRDRADAVDVARRELERSRSALSEMGVAAFLEQGSRPSPVETVTGRSDVGATQRSVLSDSAFDANVTETERRSDLLGRAERAHAAAQRRVETSLRATEDLRDRRAATEAELIDLQIEAGALRVEHDHAEATLADATRVAELRAEAVGGAVALSQVLDSDLPAVVLDAYVTAADRAGPGCWVPWTILAGIGKVESRHGTYGGASVDRNGLVFPKIIGIPLDGTRNTARIMDTDGGRMDGDTVYDRAVGPMQFIPGTWARNGADGNGDGISDPHNLYDAALSAAQYLCRVVPGATTDDAGVRRALLGYNRSTVYGNQVLAHAAVYAALDLPAAAPPAAPQPAPNPAPAPDQGG